MTSHQTGPKQRLPGPVLAAAFLFNLGQGVLRPSLPLYLQRSFTANYRMVTLIPVVFGAGKWIASLPTGYLLDRFGRPLMIWGLLLIAIIDLASIMTSTYSVFLGFRALGGVGWAMFATVAATAMVSVPAVQRRGRAVSLLLMSETAGLLLGSAVGGWLYQGVGAVSPFIFESACMLVAAVVVGRWAALPARPSSGTVERRDWHLLSTVLRTPGVLVMGLTNAVLIAIQTGVIVFLFPLYLANRVGVGPEAVGAFISLDDPEFLAGGTVARLVREGREVTYVIVTNGNKGSSDRAITSQHLVPIRQEEQRRAARVLGVERVEFLGYEDGELEDTRNLRRDVTRQIRLWRPELIISQRPKRIYSNFPGWHRDHRITGSVVLDCIYPLARDHLAFPELFPEYEPHQVREVYLVQWEQPSLLVDITDTMEVKLKAIACHVSQVGDLKAVEARMRGRAATLGEAKGQMYAEGFDHVLLPG